MFRFLYLAAIAAVLSVCFASCGTTSRNCIKSHEGVVYKTPNYGCAAYN